MLGALAVRAVPAVILVVFGVLLTRWGRCTEHREDGLQDGAEELVLQHRLQEGGEGGVYSRWCEATADYQRYRDMVFGKQIYIFQFLPDSISENVITNALHENMSIMITTNQRCK